MTTSLLPPEAEGERESVVPSAIHRITTVHAGARRSHRALAECPRRDDAVDVDVCAACPHARGFVGGGGGGGGGAAGGGGGAGADGTRHVLCAVERTAPVLARAGTVGGVMRRDVVCVRPELDIDDIVLLFIERSIGGVPVVDADDKPLGMISKTDLVSTYARHRGSVPVLDSFDADVAASPPPVVARELMSSVVFTLRESESLVRAAELFAAERVHRAPVVDAAGKVVGVLTSFDIVRALAGVDAGGRAP